MQIRRSRPAAKRPVPIQRRPISRAMPRHPRPMPRPMPGNFQPMPMPSFHGGFGGKTIDPAILDQIRGSTGTFNHAPPPMDPFVTDQMGPGPGPDGGAMPAPQWQLRQFDPAILAQIRQRFGGMQRPMDPFQEQFDPIELMGRSRGLAPQPHRWEGQLNQDALNRIFQRPPSRAMQFQAL